MKIGPGVVLLGLSIGSGEFVLWPRLVSEFGFVVFWAAVVGVTIQFFLNMEIERWTLACTHRGPGSAQGIENRPGTDRRPVAGVRAYVGRRNSLPESSYRSL